MNKKYVGLSALSLLCASVLAQQEDTLPVEQLDEVVVTDSRFQLKRENSGKTVVKITAEELQKSQGRTLAEIINSKSGVEINGSRSVAGQNLGYYVRGGNNRQVLVLLDGVQVNDPSQIANDFDLRLLDVNTIESIEIVKGAASTLYGNAAATAVINITTKKASKKAVALNVVSVIGTNQSQDEDSYQASSFTNNVSLNGTLDKFEYRFAFGNQYTDGLSAVDSPNAESDPFSRYNGSLRLGYKFSNTLKLNVFGSFDDYRTDIDGFPAPLYLFADTNDQALSEQYRFGVNPEFSYAKGSIALNAAYTKINRETISDFPSTVESKLYVVDVFNKYVFNDAWHTIVGLNYQKSETMFAEEVEMTNTDPYANLVYVSDFGFNLNLGGRLNNHSEYGNHFIYNFNPSYVMPMGNGYGKLFGSYSTSFIAPSLYQLFDGFYGNPELEAEENRTVEAGLEFVSGKKFRLSGLYFNRNEENTVLFTMVDPVNFIFQYANAEGEAKVHGVEFEVETTPLKDLKVTANYSFTELKEGYRVRLPKHRANATLGYSFSENTFASLAYQYVGSRFDTDFSAFQDVEMDAYSLIDLYASHQFKNDRFKIFAGITNLFNEDYHEILGYTTRGRNINLGLNINL